MFALVEHDQRVDESGWRRDGGLSQFNLAAGSVEGGNFICQTAIPYRDDDEG
jgi:hypothetical protein